MSGRNLVEMEASDMMDCLHFLFEEDFTAVAEDHARSRSAIRDTLYSELYGVSYTFKMKDPARGKYAPTAMQDYKYPTENEYESLGDAQPVNPRKEDPFSPRTDSKNKKKIEFVDSSSVPLVEQSFEGLDAPLN